MRDAQFREVQSEIRRGCRTYQIVTSSSFGIRMLDAGRLQTWPEVAEST